MKTRKQKETNEKEIHLLEQKGYERMMNEIMPVRIFILLSFMKGLLMG